MRTRDSLSCKVIPPLTHATGSSGENDREAEMTSHSALRLLREFFSTNKEPAGSSVKCFPNRRTSAHGTRMTTPIAGASFRINVAISIELSSVLCISKRRTLGCMLRKRFIAALFLRASATTSTP